MVSQCAAADSWADYEPHKKPLLFSNTDKHSTLVFAPFIPKDKDRGHFLHTFFSFNTHFFFFVLMENVCIFRGYLRKGIRFILDVSWCLIFSWTPWRRLYQPPLWLYDFLSHLIDTSSLDTTFHTPAVWQVELQREVWEKQPRCWTLHPPPITATSSHNTKMRGIWAPTSQPHCF